MSIIRRVAAAVERWYLDDAPLEPVAACRIGLGLSFLVFYLQMAPSHDLVFGPEGMVRYGIDPAAPSALQSHAGWLLAGVLIGAAGFASGCATRASGALLIAAHLGHTVQTPHFTWGWAMAAPALVMYVICSRSHHIWSIDAWLHRRRHPDRPRPRTGPAWPMRLLQVNAIAIYLAAAWHRIDDGAWLRGEMVFEALATTVFTRAPGLDVSLHPYAGWLEALCWYTWIVELAAPVLLWFRRTQRWMALLLLTVHIGLELAAFVGSWQFMMMSLLMVFLEPRWLCRLFEWPSRLLSRGSDARRSREIQAA